MNDMTEYYSIPGDSSRLDEWQAYTSGLPEDPVALSAVVRGLIIHEGVVRMRKLSYSPRRMRDREVRSASGIVKAIVEINPAPLRHPRPEPDRMVGFCYHFALLLCSLLRAKGIPARARCGFSSYYKKDAWIDQWVTEYWHGGGWVLIDADSGRDVLTRRDFLNAGEAWLLCRSGKDDAGRYGNHVLWGWDELRGSLVNDLGSLSKVEAADWDWCKPLAIPNREAPYAPLDERLDSIAPLVANDVDFAALRTAYDGAPDFHPT